MSDGTPLPYGKPFTGEVPPLPKQDEKHFSIIASSDPQLPWCETSISAPLLFYNQVNKCFHVLYRLWQNYLLYSSTSFDDGGIWSFPDLKFKWKNLEIISSTKPAIALLGDNLYMAVVSSDRKLISFYKKPVSETLNSQVIIARDWYSAGEYPYRDGTISDLSLTALGQSLFLTFRGSDSSFNLMKGIINMWEYRYTKSVFQPNGSSSIIPFNGGLISAYVNMGTITINKYSEHGVFISSVSFPRPNSILEMPLTGVSLAVHKNKCYIAYTSAGLLVRISNSTDGEIWSPSIQIPNTHTKDVPALASSNSVLCCVYKTKELSEFLYSTTSADGTAGSWSLPIRLPLNRENNSSGINDNQEANFDFALSQVDGTYKSIARLIRNKMLTSNPVKAVLINGDFTSNSDKNHVAIYFETLENNLNSIIPYYLGLGNHDISNNISSSSEGAINAILKVYARHSKDNMDCVTKPDNVVEITGFGEYHGSFAYYFLVNGVMIIQLQYHPSFEKDFFRNVRGFFLRSSLSFLKQALILAMEKKTPVIVCLHDFGDAFKAGVDGYDDFINTIKLFRVSAVIAGHIHENCGFKYNLGEGDVPIPFFRCGAASYQNYLYLEFDLVNMKCSATPVYFNSLTDPEDYHFQKDKVQTFDLLVPVSPQAPIWNKGPR